MERKNPINHEVGFVEKLPFDYVDLVYGGNGRDAIKKIKNKIVGHDSNRDRGYAGCFIAVGHVSYVPKIAVARWKRAPRQ